MALIYHLFEKPNDIVNCHKPVIKPAVIAGGTRRALWIFTKLYYTKCSVLFFCFYNFLLYEVFHYAQLAII